MKSRVTQMFRLEGERWRFVHPRTEELVQDTNQASGADQTMVSNATTVFPDQ